jgi:hypothetical protein
VNDDPEGHAGLGQHGITSAAEAGAFLEALRRRDVLVLPSADGDRGYPIVARGQQQSGGASP